MKLYSKSELKHSRIFFDKTPPKFGIYFIIFVVTLLVITTVLSVFLIKPTVVKAEGIVTTIDSEYLYSSVSGNVSKILVREGEYVEANETILVLENGQNEGQTDAISSQLDILNEQEQSLQRYIESLENKKNYLDSEGIDLEYYGKMEYYLAQLSNEVIQRASTLDEISTLEKKLETIDLEQENRSEDSSLSIEDDGEYENLPDQNESEVKNNGAEKEAERTSTKAELKQLQDQLSMSSQAENTRLQLLADAGQVQSSLKSKKTELDAQLILSKNQDDLLEVKANTEGTIHYLSKFENGVSVQQNQIIGEISETTNEVKIIEVYLHPFDRTKVELGQKVKVNVLGVNHSVYRMLEGSIVSIENETVYQESSEGGQSYYKINVDVEEYVLKGGDAHKNIEVTKSMPVQAQIVYEEESYFSWLMDKLSLNR